MQYSVTMYEVNCIMSEHGSITAKQAGHPNIFGMNDPKWHAMYNDGFETSVVGIVQRRNQSEDIVSRNLVESRGIPGIPRESMRGMPQFILVQSVKQFQKVLD